jgi:two-component system chemotaxis response regulator CheY
MLDVLVVDDSDLIRTMILKTLRMAQVPLGAAYEAGNGREALDILAENWVDLVLTDINMPVMDGLEMVSRMRTSEDMAGIPVIIVSTEGAASRIAQLEEMGVSAYVRKPFTPEKLRDVISGLTSDWTENGDHEKLLHEIFETVLERFAFMYGEPVKRGELPEPGTDLLIARMTFSGGQEGAMAIAAPRELCSEMAANVLGGDPEDFPLERAADALGEVLNMACGHVASALTAEEGASLAPPVVQRFDLRDWRALASAAHTAGFVVEDRPVLISLGVR